MKLFWTISLSLGVHAVAASLLVTTFLPSKSQTPIEIVVSEKQARAPRATSGSRQARSVSAGTQTAQTWPELVSQPKLEYPLSWKERNLTGAVRAKLKISSLGSVMDVQVLEAQNDEMAALAEKAMRDFRFRPAQNSGKAVASEIEYSYRFILR